MKKSLAKIQIDGNRFIPQTGSSTTEILIAFTLEMASGELTLENSRQWFAENITNK